MHISNFLHYLKFVKRYSQNTVIAYEHDLNQFNEFIHKTENFTNIIHTSHIQIRKWIVTLNHEGLSKTTINRKISSVSSFYNYLIKQDIILSNPLKKISKLKTAKNLPDFFTENQINEVIKTISHPDNFWELQEQVILELFYNTGIRLSELINIQLPDLNLSSPSIKVTGKRNKSRIIPISGKLTNLLNAFIDTRADYAQCNYLFVTKKGQQTYPRLVQRTIKKQTQHFKTVKQSSPHTIRHTTATHLLNNGADINAVKSLLGHSSLAATQIYTHNTIEHLQKIYKQAHPKSVKQGGNNYDY